MQSVDALRLVPVWVDPKHRVATAKVLMRGHGLRVLAVMHEGQIVGYVTKATLARQPDGLTVEELMDGPAEPIDAKMRIRQVAALFVESARDYAPVFKGGEFLGVVTSTMLLRELGQSHDPLTDLSWSDRLREWGVEHLKEGHEVTIIFIDLDEFGSYNKLYGHVVGDSVIRLVAEGLKASIDPGTDLLVRYGGDEFAIGTLRLHDDAAALARRLREHVSGALLPGIEQPVTFSVGLYGGRRSKERENTHYAATLDNLINLASRDCTRSKPKKAAASAPVGPAVVIESIVADESPGSITEVMLSVDGQPSRGYHARGRAETFRSVAEAARKALEKALPGRALEIDSLEMASDGARGRVLRLQASLVADGDRREIDLARPTGSDPLLAAARLVADSFSGS